MTPWTISPPGSSDLHCLPEFAYVCVHRVGDAIYLFLYSFSFCLWSFPAGRSFLMSQLFSSESALHIRWPKHWIFSFSNSSSNEFSGFISFRINWFDFLTVEGTLKSLQIHNLTTIQKHQFFSVQPSLQSSSHIRTY